MDAIAGLFQATTGAAPNFAAEVYPGYLFERKGWDPTFAKAQGRFYCSECWRTKFRKLAPVKFATCREEPTVRLPMPDEREWKRAINRFRS